MEWYFWFLIAWVLCGLAALGMQFRDRPAMRENIGWAEFWPTVLGPVWLAIKLWDWLVIGRTY
jgi:hypothetical protein